MECLFFINPKSGSGAGERLAEEIESFQLPVAVSGQVVFTDPDRLHVQVHSCASRKDLVVICGGDGTINAVISELLQLDRIPAVAFIPLGTGNDIARGTGWLNSWKKLGLNGLYHAIKKAGIGSLDVWSLTFTSEDRVQEYIFAAYAGFGCDGRICRDFIQLDNFLKSISLPSPARKLLYVPPGVKALCLELSGKTGFDFTIEGCSPYRSTAQFESAEQILFLNVPSYAGGSLVMKDADFSDGRLECLLFRNCLDYFFHILFSRFGRFQNLSPFGRADCFRFRILKDVYFQIDGEPSGKIPGGSRAIIKMKRALPVLRPLKDDLCRSTLSENEETVDYDKAPAPAARPVIT